MKDEPEGLCDLPGFDQPGLQRPVGRRIKSFQQWIEHEPLERWSLLHDTFGARYGVMTTNLAECYNFVLREAGLSHLQLLWKVFSMAR